MSDIAPLTLPLTALPFSSPTHSPSQPTSPLPPYPTLSAEEVLATALVQFGPSYTIQSAPDTSSSVSSFSRPAHTSSKHNTKFGAILINALDSVPQDQLDRFKSFVRAIPIRFPSPTVARFRGWSVTTEGDVAHFLDAQVIDAAWQVVLEMVPSERGCDLTATKQLTIKSSVPDQLFGLQIARDDGTTQFEPCTILEIKAPGYVTGLVASLQHARTVRTDPTTDWVAITSQLRKYAVETCCRDIIVMDDHCGLYFRFAEDSADIEDRMEFLIGSANHPTSLRELIAFACWRGLKRKTTLAIHTLGSSASTTTVPYTPVLHGSGRGKHPTGAPTEPQPKRSRRNATGNTGADSNRQFRGWDNVDTFTMSVTPITPYELAPSTDSGYLGSSPPHGTQPPKRERDPPTGTSWSVVDVAANHVAVLECDGQEFIGKWFGVRPDWDWTKNSEDKEEAEVYLGNELAVYTICHTLQGAEIPHCYGIGQLPGVAGVILVLEYIPGPTLTQTMKAGLNLDPPRKERLKSAATDAIKALHAHGVVHLDLHGWNLIVRDEDTVVVVDFDVSMVYPDGRGVREWEDRVFLKAAFEV